MQDGRKAVWSIPYVSEAAFFPSLKHNFIAYRSSSRLDCIFEIHQLWQSGFSGVYSNCCCSCSFEPEIIKIGQSSHKMYSNKILNFQESTTILNACPKKKKGWKLIEYTTSLSLDIKILTRFLSLRVFGLLSSYLLLLPQRFGRYVLRPSSGICQTREPSRNFVLYWIHGGHLFWFR